MGLHIIVTDEVVNSLNNDDLIRITEDGPLYRVYKHTPTKEYIVSKVFDEEEHLAMNKSKRVVCLSDIRKGS